MVADGGPETADGGGPTSEVGRWRRPPCWLAAPCVARPQDAVGKGVEVTRLGRRVYSDQLVERLDARGIHLWIGVPPPSGLAVPGPGLHAVVSGRIAVTPIHLDLTGRRLLRRLKTWSGSSPSAGYGLSDAARASTPAGLSRRSAAPTARRED